MTIDYQRLEKDKINEEHNHEPERVNRSPGHPINYSYITLDNPHQLDQSLLG